jgi:hypothetical protein
MIDINELRLLVQAVIGWGCCNQAWLDQSEDTPAVVVGHINEDGETYPVVTIDCDQYSAAGQSLPLGKFYAAANPAVINEILNRLEAVEEERDALRAELTDLRNSMAFRTSLIGRIEAEREDLYTLIAAVKKQVNAEFRLRMKKEIECNALCAKVEAMERQEPVAWCDTNETGPFVEGRLHRKTKRAAELLHRDIDALLVTTPETKS